MVSAARARAVEVHLRRLLAARGAGEGWQASSWGGGAGAEWCRRHGLMPKQTSIAILLMTGEQ